MLSLHQLVPELKDASGWQAWEASMQSYLESQGIWRLMQKDKPTLPKEEPTDADEMPRIQILINRLEKWEEADSRAKGCIKLRVHFTIANQIKSLETAKVMWNMLVKTYGKPGPTMAFVELKRALNIQIPENADPSPAINALVSHFGRLQEMNFLVPNKIQVLILLARLPPSMDHIIQNANTRNMKDWETVDIASVRPNILLAWEQRSGKKPQQQQPKAAQKISAVKRGSNDAPAFSEQQKEEGQKKQTRRGKKKPKQAQVADDEDNESVLAQGSADQGYAQIASPIFLPPAPKIF